MTVITRHVHTPFGCMQAVQVMHTQFRLLLQQQRIEPVRTQWAGERFRMWRVMSNNASQMTVDHATCLAYIEGMKATDPRAKFAIIDGGKTDDAPRYEWKQTAAQEARARWREADGFVKALDP